VLVLVTDIILPVTKRLEAINIFAVVRGAAGQEAGREASHEAGHEDIPWKREGEEGGMR
jgi:hypothetical protein